MDIHSIVDQIVADAERPWMSAVWGKSGEKVVTELRELTDDPEFGAINSAGEDVELNALFDFKHPPSEERKEPTQ